MDVIVGTRNYDLEPTPPAARSARIRSLLQPPPAPPRHRERPPAAPTTATDHRPRPNRPPERTPPTTPVRNPQRVRSCRLTCTDEIIGKDTVKAGNIRRSFRAITRKAGIGEKWTPRELRHSFVSIMRDNGVPIETIADLVGHAGTAVTEKVYRHQLRPVITKGAETMHTIFEKQAQSA